MRAGNSISRSLTPNDFGTLSNFEIFPNYSLPDIDCGGFQWDTLYSKQGNYYVEHLNTIRKQKELMLTSYVAMHTSIRSIDHLTDIKLIKKMHIPLDVFRKIKMCNPHVILSQIRPTFSELPINFANQQKLSDPLVLHAEKRHARGSPVTCYTVLSQRFNTVAIVATAVATLGDKGAREGRNAYGNLVTLVLRREHRTYPLRGGYFVAVSAQLSRPSADRRSYVQACQVYRFYGNFILIDFSLIHVLILLPAEPDRRLCGAPARTLSSADLTTVCPVELFLVVGELVVVPVQVERPIGRVPRWRIGERPPWNKTPGSGPKAVAADQLVAQTANRLQCSDYRGYGLGIGTVGGAGILILLTGSRDEATITPPNSHGIVGAKRCKAGGKPSQKRLTLRQQAHLIVSALPTHAGLCVDGKHHHHTPQNTGGTSSEESSGSAAGKVPKDGKKLSGDPGGKTTKTVLGRPSAKPAHPKKAAMTGTQKRHRSDGRYLTSQQLGGCMDNEGIKLREQNSVEMTAVQGQTPPRRTIMNQLINLLIKPLQALKGFSTLSTLKAHLDLKINSKNHNSDPKTLNNFYN
ncbi:hypothetical protein HUJ05_001692 [Dendroctonus ponderosae]|nr:hypothetical protein HUJ05_001692 [Dendroctonus ponderosae]